MNTRQIIVIFCLFAVFFSALSIASASDVVDNMTVSVANDENTIDTANSNNEILTDPPNGTFADLEGDIEAVPGSGNLPLEKNYTYNGVGQTINISKSMTIDGQGHTIDADGQIAIFNITNASHVILKNIRFANGHGENGSAIKVNPGSSVEIINCTFINNTATNFGGAIYIVAGGSDIISKITDSIFEENKAYNGGAIYSNSDKATIEGTTFTGNHADNDGAGVYIAGDNCNLANSTFTDNVAGDDGPAVYWQGSNGIMYNLTCSGNRGESEIDPKEGKRSTSKGGTICLTGSNVTVKKSSFANSLAGYNGGALFITGNNDNVIDCIFDNCTARDENGGVLYIIGNHTNVFDCSFENCNANLSGGVIYVNGSYATINNASFTKNGANLDGAALYVAGDNCILSNSTFTDNIAGDDGGAVFWQGDNGILYNITCLNNKGISDIDPTDGTRSNSKGGTICLTGSNVTIEKSSFTKSFTVVDGGALFITGNDVNVLDCIFDDCRSNSTNGGAIYIIGNNTKILDCDFNNCYANLSGGVIYVEGNNATINNGKFTNNKANLDGAALYIAGDDCTLSNSTFTGNTAGDDGGAIYWEGDNGLLYNITCVNNKGISDIDPTDGTRSNSKGGTICLTGSNVTIEKSNFTKSSAVVDGGALFITGNDVNVLNSVFDDCTSTNGNGGAIYIIGNNTHVVDSEFNNCRVDVTVGDHRGGAIYIAGNDANITNSSFTNTKGLVGGAIYIDGNDTIVDNSKFRQNTAVSSLGGTGGAINVNGANAIISNSDFSEGSAVNYGGAIAVWGPNAIIVNDTFENSKSTKLNGGAIYVNGANATISLSNFTSCNALGDQYSHGGAIEVEGEGTRILGCNFDDCDSRLGGVIHVSGANAVIDSSTFKDSEAYQGGAIYVDGVNTTISKSNFTDITARDYGGAIYVAGANANISESNFLRSKVTNHNGGAIYIKGENTLIEKSNFTSAEANSKNNKALGGAIYIEGSDAVIKESDFDNCKAAEGGGAIYAYGNSARIEDSTFNASTSKYGGAIYLTAWGASVTGSNISECIATENGGGIYVAEGSIQIAESNFDDCIAQGSSANNGGGAIYINGPDTHISASNFSSNKAPNKSARGGSIFIKGERTIIEDSEFEWGNAYQGGEIFIEGADALIDTSAFINSSSRDAGGSIYVKGDEATIRESSFDNVSAKSNGGAIVVDGAKTDILNSSFYNCTVGMSNIGGAIYIDDIGTTVAYSNFTLSRAGTGGAIYINGQNTTITYCNLNNNTANTAGAIMVHGDDTILSNSNFTYNTALTLSGGALDIGGSNASVYYSWFDHNEANTEGGAINWIGGHGDDSIIGSTFTNNICYGTSKGGGAIHWTASNTAGYIGSGGLIQDSVFINNTAAGRHGGALNWFQTRDSKINNCLFINNTANADGGALYTGDQRGNSYNLNMSNCQFYNNTAGKYGGAIANQMANSYVFNNTFDGNLANAGGGSILMKEGPAKNSVIDHCYIYNSRVGDLDGKYGEGGGAILLGVNGDSNITISNSVVMNSTIAKGPGGAIAILGAQCSLINVSIENASTQNAEGGAIYWKGTDGYLNNVTIFKSSSHSTGSRISDGGAIYVAGWNCVMNDIRIFEASANTDETAAKTNYGGAIYIGGSNSVLTNIIIDNATSANVKMNGAGGAIYQNGYGGTLINATISNTYANGNGGAIYWKGSTPGTITNISITYSQTEVINSTNSADGGAIYSTTIGELSNVTIDGARAYKNNGDVHGGAIYLRDAVTLNNITVEGSRASTDDGTSYGGAVFLERYRGSTSVWVYNSTFNENNADLGGGLYFNKVTGRISGTSFTGNVANKDGGALYGIGSDIIVSTSEFEHNSAKRGGAIFSQNVHIQIDDSIMEFNTAEEKGGAIYHNYIDKSGSSWVRGSDLINNTAFQGSAIYVTKVNRFTLANDVLLDNQANSNKFIEKHVGVDEDGNNYTSAIFLGFDNLLNAIWQEATNPLSCTNVTYWGVDGKTVADSAPTQSDREVNINVTVEMYDDKGVQINTADLATDKDGKVKYTFDAKDGETYYFAYVHKTDRYYTYLRDTLSNSSLVKIYVYTPIYYAQNQTVLIELTDGAWGNLNGTVTVTFNDTAHTTFTVDVKNGTGVKYNITDLAIGKYNATASFAGDLNHTGDTDWTLFEVLPYDDVEIAKDVNITADYVNVTDIIKYTITVTNHGPSVAYNVNVTERLSPYLRLSKSKATKGEYNLTGGYWYIGELDVNDFETLTIIAEVVHMGPITNTVWVTSFGKDINETNNNASAHNFTAVPIVDLRINKKVNVTKDVIAVLDVIKFDIEVFNDGPCNATGVIVQELVDDHLQIISNTTSQGKYSGGTWNIGNMTNGTNATLTIVAKVVYSGNISNVVRVSGFENETDYTNNVAKIKNITAVANVDLKVTKDVNVSGVISVTDRVKFTITVTNNGPCNATGVYVGERLSPHLRHVSNVTTIGEYDGATWIIGNLNSGEVHNLTIIAEVISEGNISNVVAIFGNDNDTNKSNNNDSIENFTAINTIDLEITKTVDGNPKAVNVTDVVVFTITVRNKGPCTATNVNVSEVLSPHLKLIRYNTWGGGRYNVTEGVWYIGNLTKDDWRDLVIVAQVISAGNISNVVVVTGTENDTNTSNNRDEIDNITALPIVDLQIDKESNFTGKVINVTDTIKYTITVFNAGPCNATNVNVSEVLSPHLKLIKNETEYGYYNLTDGIWYIGTLNNQSTAVLTITAQVISNGTISNGVIVNSTEKDTDLSNNQDHVDDIAAVNIVDLQIKKTVDVDRTEIDITEKIMFTIEVYNAGSCDATGVYVCEPLSDILRPIQIVKPLGTTYDGYTWYIGNLNSGEGATLVILAEIAYAGIIENEVNVTGNEIDTNLSNNKDNITPIRVSAHIDIGVNKTVNVTTGVVNVSDLVEFTITAYNNGPCNASGVYVLEALDSHLEECSHVASRGTTYSGNTWVIGNLDAGENVTLTIVARVMEVGNFSNYVKVFGWGNDTNESNNNYTIPNITARPVVDLEISKEANVSGIVEFGDQIMFTIIVRNNGPCDATNVNVSEVLSPHLKLDHYNATGNTIYNVDKGIWYIGSLAKNDWRQLVIYANVTSVGNITNSVRVNSTENDTNKSNNNDTIPNITAIPIVDLQIKKDVNVTSDLIYVLDKIRYTITVYNDGPCNATNVNVTEVLSSHLKLLDNVTANGYYNVTDGIWYIGDLANKSTAVLTIDAQVISDGVISNVVVVNSTEKDTNLSNNRAEIKNITSVLLFDLQINKTVNVTTIDVGVTDVIQFNITVYNDGPCNATNVTVTEVLSDKLALISNVTTVGEWNGFTWYIGNLNAGDYANLTIVARVAYSGIIENVVIVTGNGTDRDPSNNKDNITPLNATVHVDLTVNKTVNVTTGVVNVTDLVKFTIVAINNCAFNAAGVYVIEDLDPHLGEYTYVATPGTTYDGHIWNIGYLNAGANATLTIIARVIAPGNFSNYVVINGSDIDTNLSNNNDTIPNITANPIVDLEIEKEANVSGSVHYGDKIIFTITVRNNGPCDATNVNVSEELSSLIHMYHHDATPGTTYDGHIWHIGDLAKGGMCKLVIYANVTSLGNITNAVNVTSTENDTNKSNNNASIPNITAEPIVDLRINKTVGLFNLTTYQTVDIVGTDVNVTNVLIFTLTVVNDGPCNATNVYIREPLSDKLRMCEVYDNVTDPSGKKQGWNASKGVYKDKYTWVIGNMTVGEKANLTIVARIVYSGIIENEVFVTSNDDDINMSNNYDNITPLVATTKVDLAINKTVNVTTGVVNVSDLVEFTITAHNYGPCNTSGVYVLEALDPNLKEEYHVASPGTRYDDGYTWYIGNLDAGANATLKIVARVMEPGNFSNYVEIFGYDIDTNESNNNKTIPNITANPIVDLEIEKEANVGNITYVGDTVVFTITVRNRGPCDATNVNVSEVLSPHLELADWTTWDGYYDVDEGVWHIGTLNKYDWRQLILVTNVVSVGNISNVVFVNSTENDTNTSNNNASIPNITALPTVDLQIMKDVNITSRFAKVYDFIEYTVTVYNDGPCNATNVMVNETINPALKFIRAETKSGYYNETEGIWHIGNLSKGSRVNLTIVTLVMRNGTVIPNLVIVNSTEKDNNPYDNWDEVDIAVLPIVDLRITKEANVTSEIGVTEKIKFVITVFNDGPCDATGIYVTESLSDKLKLLSNVTTAGKWDGYTWNIPKLLNGTNATLTIIAQAVYAGNITNVVVVHAYQNETNYTNNNASIPNVTAITNADLQITKAVNVSSAVVGDLIKFTVTVRNNGPCDATGVIVTEALDSHLKHFSNTTTLGDYDGYTWNIGNLTNQSSAVLTIVARVVSEGNISNVVTVSGIENDTNTSNNKANITNITSLNIVDLQITKEVNVSSVVVGDLIKFTVTVRNNGPCDATGVFVGEALDSHLEYVSNTTTLGDYDGFTWMIGNLTNQSSAVLTIVARVVSEGNISNVVVVNSIENDTNKSNNEANITNITSLNIVDLQITKVVNVSSVVVGDLIKFTVTVRNNGPCDATGVFVGEALDSHLEYVSNTTTLGDYDGFTWMIGNLTNQSSAVLTIVARVVSEGNISNVVTVSGIENDTNTSNNKANITNITSLNIVDLQITKEANVSSVVVGDLIKFTIFIRNDGPCDAHGVFVAEKLSPLLEMVSSNATVGEYDGFTWKNIGTLTNQSNATLTIVARVMSAGNISNVVTVKGIENDTNTSNNVANITNITAQIVVDLRINKTVNATVVNVTDLVEYNITVVNAGPCNATGVNVTEKLSPFVKLVKAEADVGYYDNSTNIWHIGDLSVNKPVVLTLTVQVIANGTIENIVIAKSRENDTNKSNNNGSSDNVTALPIVDIRISKVVNTTVVNVNDLIEYTITVVNYGPSNATGVNVTDKLSDLLKFVSFESSRKGIVYDDKTGISSIGNLNAGETVILTITARVISNGTIENVAFAKSRENDTNLTNNNDTSDNVTSEKRNTPISIDAYDITYGEDEILKVTLPKGATGTVNITVRNVTYAGLPINNGEVTLPIIDPAGGDYPVTVVYGGDGVYVGNSTSGTFNVARVVPIITIEVEDIWVGEIEVANITVNAPGFVYVTIYNRTVMISLDNGVVTTDVLTATKHDYKGNATWNLINLPVGAYPAYAFYPGNENYTSVDTSDLFHVRDKQSTVVVTADDIYVGEDAVINIKVGPEGLTGNVTVTVDGEIYIVPLDNNSEAILVVPGLKAGTKLVTVEYKGTILFKPSENRTTFDVLKLKPQVDIEAPEITVGEDGEIIVYVPEDATGTITIEIDGKQYTADIEDGVAIFIIPGLKAGEHDIIAYYSGDEKYLPGNTVGSIKVNPVEKNDTTNATNVFEHDGGISLYQYPTGNPIILLILILLVLGSGQMRKFKK